MSSRTGTRGGLPRALRLAVGAAAVGVGVALTLRPFTSLDALTFLVAASLILAGLGELLGSAGSDTAARDRLAGGVLIVTALVAAIAPGLTVRGIAIVVGIGMVISGVARLAAGSRGRVDERYSSIVGGLASVVFGVLALAWPDITILVIGLLVGPVAIVLGAREMFRALRGASPDPAASSSRARVLLRAVGTTAALVLALMLVLVSALVHNASPSVPSFYAWSGSLPARPGVLLRHETTTQGMPAGSRAVRILYTTTGLNGRITPASGLVVESATGPPGPRPVVLWEHGTTGVAQKCGPSVLGDPFKAGAMFSQAQVLAHGWVLVAPDYLGLGASPASPVPGGGSRGAIGS